MTTDQPTEPATDSPAVPGIHQYDGKNAFAGLDVAAATRLAEERRAAQAEADTEGGYAPRQFRISGNDEVYTEADPADVHQEQILARGETPDPWVPIVDYDTALQLVSDLGTWSSPDEEAYSHSINDDQGVVCFVGRHDVRWVIVDRPLKGDPEWAIIFDLPIFELVE